MGRTTTVQENKLSKKVKKKKERLASRKMAQENEVRKLKEKLVRVDN